MNYEFEKVVLESTGAASISRTEVIQSLWSGYGEILRCFLEGADYASAVVKHISLEQQSGHPRGWNTDISHQRKLKSYQVETAWYSRWSFVCDDFCHVPKCLSLDSSEGNILLVMEDLNSSGYPMRCDKATLVEMRSCLKWLANFHAKFMGEKPYELWEQGTYWHLETRPDELEAIDCHDLKQCAETIDRQLSSCAYQTIIHGDAKLANFCFTNDGSKAAAVDFQYVGGGCGMKDIIYFISSCLGSDECDSHEDELLDFYFDELKSALSVYQPEVDALDVENSWRCLHNVAWADFYRFLKGWSPEHWKVHNYSTRLTQEVLKQIKTYAKGDL